MRKDGLIKLRAHHFFDIIRDFGSRKAIGPHAYGHSFQRVAEMVRDNSNLKMRMVVRSDEVCRGCVYFRKGKCVDKISHRKDFVSKEKFNNHIDRRIMKKGFIKAGDIVTPIQLCRGSKNYLDNIDYIYQGNDSEYNRERKRKVVVGLQYYSKLHGFELSLR